MASSFSTKINNLRKKSRVLLSCLEENSKTVRKEVKKLRLGDSSSTRYLTNGDFIYGINCENSDIWKLRNDSSGVGAALCPDYFRFSPKYESKSLQEMSGNRRTLVKNDKKSNKSSASRRAVKECYCYSSLNSETRKLNQRSVRTRLKSDFNEIKSTVSAPESARINLPDLFHETNEEHFYSPPLSSATLRRAQKIDYTPRSKFLRRVQSKVNTLRNSSPGSTERTITTRACQSNSETKINRSYDNLEAEIIPVVENYRGKKSNRFPRKHNCLNDDEEDGDKIPKKTLLPKKTIVSKKGANIINNNPKKSLDSKSNENNHEWRMRQRSSSPRDKHSSKYSARKELNKVDCPCSEYGKALKFKGEPLDFDINRVKKFRDTNYFDTHASDPSLLGSRSSGSVQQFHLNERLFAEPVRKIHRDDLVVSIPPCATRQKRGIHYFPRSVVKQEKNHSNINCHSKKRRCPSCPLIGHAVDLGALKISHPTNSLALRFQKGITRIT